MTNTNLLKSKIIAYGFTQKQISIRLNMSLQSFSLKLHSKRQFKSKEISLLKDLLKLTNNELTQIFFANNGEFNSHYEKI